MRYFRQRIKEPSTWAGIAMMALAGAQAIATKDPNALGAVVAGAVAMFLPETGATPK